MAGFSQTLETKIVDWIFRKTSFGSAPTELWVSLHSNDPGDTGANELSTSVGAYTRARLDPDDPGGATSWNTITEPSTAKTVTNKGDITFPACTASWNSGAAMTYWGLWDGKTAGGSTFLIAGSISGSGVVVLDGNTLKFVGGTPGQLSVAVD
jgi:hypothetical protein